MTDAELRMLVSRSRTAYTGVEADGSSIDAYTGELQDFGELDGKRRHIDLRRVARRKMVS